MFHFFAKEKQRSPTFGRYGGETLMQAYIRVPVPVNAFYNMWFESLSPLSSFRTKIVTRSQI